MKNRKIPEEHQKRLRFIGTLIREYRVAEGWTQQMLSEYSNLNRNTIYRAESGSNFSLLTLFELADTLDINLSELFDEE